MEGNPKLSRTGTVILESPVTEIKRTPSAVLSRYPSRLIKTSSVFSQDNLEIKSNEWLDAYLTKDILFYIFTLLRRKELSRASMVCKRWRSITKDPYFGWISIPCSLVRIEEFSPSFPREILHQLQKGLLDLDIQPSHNTFELFYKQTRIPCRLDYETMFATVHPLCKNYPKLWRYSLEQNRSNWTIYEVIFELNVKEFEDTVRRKEDVPGAGLLIPIIENENRQVNQTRLQEVIQKTGEHIPTKSVIPHKQSGLREGLNLYKYQLDAIAWMKSVEDDTKNGVTFKDITLIPWRSAKTEVLLDPRSKKFATFDDIPAFVKEFTPKGGVLADEMGLGKTIEGLILANPKDKTDVSSKNSSTDTNSMTESSATLVVCPNHLAQQWENEILKNSNPPLKILKFTTIREYGKATKDDIASADVVIVSVQFLRNENYSADRFSTMLTDFKWHRQVIDEGHELVRDGNTTTVGTFLGHHFPPYTISRTLGYLGFPQHWDSDHHIWPFTDLLISNLYWRNTKASVKDEYKIPPYVEELVVLEFTDIERTLYEYYGLGSEEQRKLCSQIPKVEAENENTLDAVRTETIFECRHRIKNLEKSIKNNEKTLANWDTYPVPYWRGNKKSYQDGIVTAQKEIETVHEPLRKLRQTLVSAERFLKICQVLKVKAPNTVLEMVAQSKKEFEIAEKQQFPDDVNTESNNNNNNSANPASTVEATPSAAVDLPQKQPDATQPEEAKTESSETKNEQPVLSETDLQRMTVPQLKAEITARGLKPKGIKADLQAQLRLYFAGKLNSETASEKTPKKAEEEEQPRRSARKRKQEDDEDEIPTSKSAKGKAASKPKPKKKSKYYDSSSEEEEMDFDFDEDEVQVKRYDITKKRTIVELVEELVGLIEHYGTKMGNLIYYLRRLWEQKPEARVIIFSQFDSVLWEVSEILNNNDIETCFVYGNVMSKNKAINAFKAANAHVRVIMLSIEKAASGTNLVEASHVVLMDPVTGTKEEAQGIESQAIARAYRQGQANQVTLIRFVILHTIEHELYVKNYLDDDESQFRGRHKDLSEIHKAIAQVNRPLVLKKTPSEARPKMIKATSIGNLLVTTSVKSIGDVLNLMENCADAVVQVPDNKEQPTEQSVGAEKKKDEMQVDQ